jgi:hypothetical protein
MVDWDETKLAKLARELTMNIRPYQAVFADFGIDEVEYYEISQNEFYKKVKEHFAQEWNSTLSTEGRVKLESLATYEQLLPILARRAMQDDTPLPAATEFGKLLAKTAGIGDPRSENMAADRFVITINLGADLEGKPIVEHYNKSIEANADDVQVSNELVLKGN